MILEKKCIKCGIVKDIHEFGFDKKGNENLSYWCRKCNSNNTKANRTKKNNPMNVSAVDNAIKLPKQSILKQMYELDSLTGILYKIKETKKGIKKYECYNKGVPSKGKQKCLRPRVGDIRISKLL